VFGNLELKVIDRLQGCLNAKLFKHENIMLIIVHAKQA